MLQIQMRILRVFGLSKAEMNSIIENAQAEGSPSLRLQERDGEYLVCVQASAPTQAMADEYCEKWVQKLRTRFGDACYGFEDTTLAQAALDALLSGVEPDAEAFQFCGVHHKVPAPAFFLDLHSDSQRFGKLTGGAYHDFGIAAAKIVYAAWQRHGRLQIFDHLPHIGHTAVVVAGKAYALPF